jgi:uncharacterized protein (TIGR03032 family)
VALFVRELALKRGNNLEAVWARHDAEWRDTAQIASHWEQARSVDPALLRFRARGTFWETLDRLAITLFVTREYEHLVLALAVDEGRPLVTFLSLPHPSGLVVDRKRGAVHVASTRNPNQILELRPVRGAVRPLVPVAARFYPGSTYLHDLALIGGRLHANAVGQNAVVRVGDEGALERVFWPRAIETRGRPRFDHNFLQLNSIAAGKTIQASFFSASASAMGTRRPGHRNFAVDGNGVVFSGETREPVVTGLTRPHSARLHRRRLWVANSGYGELGLVERGRFRPVRRFEGWTRGLAFAGGVAFVGTSRVIPRFSAYAPGLDLAKSRCAVEALDAESGETLGSLVWPGGNQIFAIDWSKRRAISGFPFSLRGRGDAEASRRLFYSYRLDRKAGP